MADVSESGNLTAHLPQPFGRVKTGFTRFQDGDILFAKITPCMENGKAAVASDLLNGVGFGSTECRMALALARLRRTCDQMAESEAFAGHALKKRWLGCNAQDANSSTSATA